jgi:hypothetical protein
MTVHWENSVCTQMKAVEGDGKNWKLWHKLLFRPFFFRGHPKPGSQIWYRTQLDVVHIGGLNDDEGEVRQGSFPEN